MKKKPYKTMLQSLIKYTQASIWEYNKSPWIRNSKNKKWKEIKKKKQEKKWKDSLLNQKIPKGKNNESYFRNED